MKGSEKARASRQVTEALRLRSGPEPNKPALGKVLVWRENIANSKPGWQGLLQVRAVDKEDVTIDFGNGDEGTFRSTAVRFYNSPGPDDTDETHRTVDTPPISAVDNPRAPFWRGSLEDARTEICGPAPIAPDPKSFMKANRRGSRPTSENSWAADKLTIAEKRELAIADHKYQDEQHRYFLRETSFSEGLTLVEERIARSVTSEIMMMLGDRNVKDSIAYLYEVFGPD
ncbi:hypothetical protein SEPCBS119000_006493 [Sporothrix epigloea]|uniref:Uncharacterized protein n=1 Tax=Sporothrix epigloea TaxID=1892477 RepID=A0ABP0E4N3_9PEZI